MIDFPSPILSVSPDVVKDLDGEDALYGMWTVFTKCKESLKDGRRLENISWRLWYREMSYSHGSDGSSTGSLSPPLSETGCASPITPVSENGPQNDFFSNTDSSKDSLLPIIESPLRHSWHGGARPPPTSNIRRLSTASMPARPGARPQQSQRVGSIIIDILPTKVVVPAHVTPRRGSSHPGRKISGSGSNVSTAKPSPAQPGSGPNSSHSSFSRGLANIAQPRPVLALPTMQLPNTPATLGAPRVVVVNPTPHPTPPATPHPQHSNAAPSITSLPATQVPPPTTPVVPVQQPSVPAAQPTSTITSSKPTANPETSALPHTRTQPPSSGANDETLKLSDRRFFLQSSESPDRDSESPERPPFESRHSGDAPEPSPSSTTSSTTKSDEVAPAVPRRNMSKPTLRRGKDVSRFTTTRSTSRLHTLTHTQRQVAQKKVTEPKKTTFNIGSASSNGTRAGDRDDRAQPAQQNRPAAPQNPAVPKPRPPSPPKHKGLVMSTSSEYTTDSDDDSEWASEDNSGEDKEKERQKQSKLREAAEEAQRQRDMFAKVPKRSYSNLNRTKSGLLSQLLNPDPAIFPPNHPYRTFSSQDMTQLGKQGRLPPPNYPTSKSSAAIPLAAQITPMNAQAPPTNGSSSSNAYRPKGRPQGQELEDTDTEEEGAENGVPLSRSLAHEKLAALAGPSRRRASDQHTHGPSANHHAPQPPQRQSNLHQQRPQPAQTQIRAHERQTIPSVATAPIPLGHPYNLPAPEPPMTPRTTRRQMLATELSESLRRNLLWERQVSKVNMLGGARRGGLGQRLQPFTAVNAQQDQRNNPADDQEARRRAALARNRSWADDYHYAGW